MILYIKNMVCSRCKMVVKDIINNHKLHPISVSLGEVEILEDIDKAKKVNLNISLKEYGFELIDDKKSRLIEKIKNEIVTLIQYSKENMNIKLSEHLANKLHHDYTYLSNIFSQIEGITIEKFYIAQKIEKVKELLKYDELSLSQIAFNLGYSSTAYLSNQFKKETGLSPSFYKSQKINQRKNLEDI